MAGSQRLVHLDYETAREVDVNSEHPLPTQEHPSAQSTQDAVRRDATEQELLAGIHDRLGALLILLAGQSGQDPDDLLEAARAMRNE